MEILIQLGQEMGLIFHFILENDAIHNAVCFERLGFHFELEIPCYNWV